MVQIFFDKGLSFNTHTHKENLKVEGKGLCKIKLPKILPVIKHLFNSEVIPKQSQFSKDFGWIYSIILEIRLEMKKKKFQT